MALLESSLSLMDPSVASDETFTLKTYSVKNDNATQNTTATLQICIRHKSEVHVQTYNNVVGLPLTLVHEAVVSPVVTSDCFAMPPHVIALPPLRRRCILKALASVSIDGSLCECLAPSIEKYVVQEAESFGYKGFGVVAELEVVRKVYVHKHEVAATTPSSLLRRRRIATKVDVNDREMSCSMMAAFDHPKKVV